jgi:site-specific recombinase XerC
MNHDRNPDLTALDAGPAPTAAPTPDLAPELRDVLRSFTSAQRAPRTRHEYEKYLRDFVRFAGISGRQELLATNSDQVIEYRNTLQARGLSPSTINGRLVAVRGLFGRLFKSGEIRGPDGLFVKMANLTL